MSITLNKMKSGYYSSPVDSIVITDLNKKNINNEYEHLLEIIECMSVERFNIVIPNNFKFIGLLMNYLKETGYILTYDLLPVNTNPYNIIFKFFTGKRVVYYESGGSKYDN